MLLSEDGKYVFGIIDEEGAYWFNNLSESGFLALWSISAVVSVQLNLSEAIGERDLRSVSGIRRLTEYSGGRDVVARIGVKRAQETAGIRDLRLGNPIKTGRENAGVKDNRVSGLLRVFRETDGLSDRRAMLVLKRQLDSIASIDSLAWFRAIIKELSEAMRGLDYRSSRIVSARMEASGIGDYKRLSSTRVVADGLVANDIVARSLLKVRLLIDFLAGGDLLFYWFGKLKQLAEVLTGYDIRVNVVGKAGVENIGGRDGRSVSALRIWREQGGFSDKLSKSSINIRLERLGERDFVRRTSLKRISELVSPADLFEWEKRIGALIVQLMENVSLIERRLGLVGKQVSDASGLRDSALKTASRRLHDSLAGVDSLSRRIVKIQRDYLTSIDYVVRRSVKSVRERGGFTDGLSKHMVYHRGELLRSSDGISKSIIALLHDSWLVGDSITHELERIEGISLEYYLRARFKSMGLEAYGASRRVFRIVGDTALIYPCDVRIDYQLGMTAYIEAECRVDIYILSGISPDERVKKALDTTEQAVKSFMENRALGGWHVLTAERADFMPTYNLPGLGYSSLRIRAFKRLAC